MPSFSPLAAFAEEAVSTAARLVRRIRDDLAAEAFSKQDRSPVTVADFAAQALIAAMLAERFPQDKLVAEERAKALRSGEHADVAAKVVDYVRTIRPEATPEDVFGWIDRGAADAHGRYWVLDPIDGTKGFLRGGQYAVALALIEGGEVLIGALACPELEESVRQAVGGAGTVALAERGRGAWWKPLFAAGDWQRLRVSPQEDPTRARLLRSYESAHTNAAAIDAVMHALGSHSEPVRMDSQVKYAVLAAGGAEVYLRIPPPTNPEYREKVWDQAAGALVVQEAGGEVTDLAGKPLDFTAGRILANNRGLVATNGKLHAAVLAALKAASAG